MDEAVLASHPRGSGSDRAKAGREIEEFAQQRPSDELELYCQSPEISRTRAKSEKRRQARCHPGKQKANHLFVGPAL